MERSNMDAEYQRLLDRFVDLRDRVESWKLLYENEFRQLIELEEQLKSHYEPQDTECEHLTYSDYKAESDTERISYLVICKNKPDKLGIRFNVIKTAVLFTEEERTGRILLRTLDRYKEQQDQKLDP